jgi:alkylation response protein AidB-like acyl-CoA dehydrogenase
MEGVPLQRATVAVTLPSGSGRVGTTGGMDFALTEEQEALRRRIVQFCRDELSEPPADGEFPSAGWAACARFGVLGWPVPAELGGSGLDPLTIAVALEALGYGCRDNGLVFAVNNHLWACAIYLVEHGSPELRSRYLPGMCDGSLIGAHAMTEEHAGSDVLGLRTTAVREGDAYLLNGVKTFVSNAPVADLFVVFARTGGDAPQESLSAFVVEAAAPGVRKTRTLRKAGLASTPMGEVAFENCAVPVENRLGREGGGYALFTSTIEWERALMFASNVGAMQRLLEACVGHSRGRRQFGRSVGTFQAVAHAIADMRVRLELARLLVYKVAWLKGQGRLALLESAMAKLYVSESLVETARAAVQIHGARGYVADYGIERELRDAIATTIYGGTSEIQRNIIAELSGVPSSSQPAGPDGIPAAAGVPVGVER